MSTEHVNCLVSCGKFEKLTITTNEVSVRINVPAIVKLLSLSAFIIVSLGIFREYYVLQNGTDTFLKDLGQIALDSEGTLAVWYSSAVMLFCSAVLFLISAAERLRGKTAALHWIVLATLFALMSIDETVSIHEVTISPLRTMFDLGGALHFSWVVVAVPVMLGLALYYLPFLAKLPTRYAAYFALSGALYVGGALGMEFVGGHFFTAQGENSIHYIVAAVIEETLELVGLSLFASVLMSYVGTMLDGLALSVDFKQNGRIEFAFR